MLVLVLVLVPVLPEPEQHTAVGSRQPMLLGGLQNHKSTNTYTVVSVNLAKKHKAKSEWNDCEIFDLERPTKIDIFLLGVPLLLLLKRQYSYQKQYIM